METVIFILCTRIQDARLMKVILTLPDNGDHRVLGMGGLGVKETVMLSFDYLMSTFPN